MGTFYHNSLIISLDVHLYSLYVCIRENLNQSAFLKHIPGVAKCVDYIRVKL